MTRNCMTCQSSEPHALRGAEEYDLICSNRRGLEILVKRGVMLEIEIVVKPLHCCAAWSAKAAPAAPVNTDFAATYDHPDDALDFPA